MVNEVEEKEVVQDWAQAKTEINQTYPKTDFVYVLDLNTPIRMTSDGHNLIKMVDGRYLSVWKSQKGVIAAMLTDEDMREGSVQICFDREEASGRVIPRRAGVMKKR